MSARERVHSFLGRAVAGVRQDAQHAVETENSLLHGVRFLLEIPTVLGHGLRALCYLLAAIVLEAIRTGEGRVFDDEDRVKFQLSWLGPAWTHERQSKWEIRLGAVFCVVVGFVFYETLAYFALNRIERSLLWATAGTLVIEPAYVRLYLSRVGDTLPSESELSEVDAWPILGGE